MSILLTKGNIDDVFKVLDNHNINSALMLDTKLKVLKIIFEKNVDIDFLKSADTFEEYNKLIKVKSAFAIELTQKEFDLIKKCMGKDKSE